VKDDVKFQALRDVPGFAEVGRLQRNVKRQSGCTVYRLLKSRHRRLRNRSEDFDIFDFRDSAESLEE